MSLQVAELFLKKEIEKKIATEKLGAVLQPLTACASMCY